MKLFIREKLFSVLGVVLLGALPMGQTLAAADEPMADEQAYLHLLYEEDQLVEVATGFAKPISHIAENVTIITAEEIDALHPHTVAEVLRGVAGVYINSTFEPSAFSAPHIQGSDYEHVLVLIDGVRLGYVFADFPELSVIPIRAVKRIEVIKGPASSTWGSALGGVINVITKDAGKTQRPTGEVFVTYGEHNTYETSAAIAGQLGRAGYYLHVGNQHSDGITLDRDQDNTTFFGKAELDLSTKAQVVFSLGQSKPEFTYYVDRIDDFKVIGENEMLFYTGTLSVTLSEQASAVVSLYRHEHDYLDTDRTLSTGYPYSQEAIYDANSTGVTGRLTWKGAFHTAVLGAEYQRSEVDTSLEYFGFMKFGPLRNQEENWAVFINDTLRWHRLTITPGIRYDRLELADPILSPSLGVTYQLADHTLLRGLVAKGFRKPNIGLAQYNVFDEIYEMFYGYRMTNPDLAPEDVRTAQVGIETNVFPPLRFKSTFFAHATVDSWAKASTDVWYNNGTMLFKGGEVEIETRPIHSFSLGANFTYVRIEPDMEPHADYYLGNLKLGYDDKRSFAADILMHYVWYGTFNTHGPTGFEASACDPIWDFHLTKKLSINSSLRTEVFLTGHNIFNGNQTNDLYHDRFTYAERWFEGGIRVSF
jgi:vitamin B12 transporter